MIAEVAAVRVDTLRQIVPVIPKVAQDGGVSAQSDPGRRSEVDAAGTASVGRRKFPEKHDQTDSGQKDSQMLRETSVQYKISRDPQRIITEIVDDSTGAVLQEIPPEKLREIMDAITKISSTGIDRKA